MEQYIKLINIYAYTAHITPWSITRKIIFKILFYGMRESALYMRSDIKGGEGGGKFDELLYICNAIEINI